MPSLTLPFQRNNIPAFRSIDPHCGVTNLSAYPFQDNIQDISSLLSKDPSFLFHGHSVRINRRSIGVEEEEDSTVAEELVRMAAVLTHQVLQ